MNIQVKSFETCNIGSLVVGDIFNRNNEPFIVMEKKFDYVKAYNMHRHEYESYHLPCGLIVTRVKGGYITV